MGLSSVLIADSSTTAAWSGRSISGPSEPFGVISPNLCGPALEISDEKRDQLNDQGHPPGRKTGLGEGKSTHGTDDWELIEHISEHNQGDQASPDWRSGHQLPSNAPFPPR